MKTIEEIEDAIAKLPTPQVDEIAGWLEALRLKRTPPEQIESWLQKSRGVAIPGVSTASIMALTRGEE